MAAASASETTWMTYSPVRSMLRQVSFFWPSRRREAQMMHIGGSAAAAVKYENGARLVDPFSLSVAVQAMGRIRTALQLRDAGESDDFTMQVPEELSDGDITLAKLARTCLGENERRLAEYDPRLLRPYTVPRLVQTALDGLLPPGNFDARVDLSRAPRGLYFYRLSTSAGTISRAFTLVR